MLCISLYQDDNKRCIVYFCKRNYILCSRLGAMWRGFFSIISKGFWSHSERSQHVQTCTGGTSQCPSRTATTLSIFAYRVSISVNARLAKATGLPCCRIAAPRPVSEASHCKIRLWLESKLLSTGSEENYRLILATALSRTSCELHTASFKVSFLNGSHKSLKDGRNLLK